MHIACTAKPSNAAKLPNTSAGTMVWFFGKNKRVDRWARFLFHCSSHGDWGKSLQIQENSTNLVNYIMNLLAQMLAEGFITGAEYDKMKAKGDVTVAGSVLRERWEAIRAEAGGDNGGEGGGEGGENGGEGGEGGSSPDDKKKGKKPKADGDEGGEGGGEGGEGGEGGQESGKGDDDGAEFDPDAIYKSVLGDTYTPPKNEDDDKGSGAGEGGEGGEGGSGEGGEGGEGGGKADDKKTCSKCGKNPCTCK